LATVEIIPICYFASYIDIGNGAGGACDLKCGVQRDCVSGENENGAEKVVVINNPTSEKRM